MEYTNEKVHYENPLLSLRVLVVHREEDLMIPWHYHREVELLLVETGMLEVHVDDEFYSLQEGDIAIIGHSQLHRDRSYGGPLHYIVLQFDLEKFFDHSTMPYIRYFFESEHPLSHTNYIFEEKPEIRREIASIVREIHKETVAKENGYELAVDLLIKKIILLLLRNDQRKVLTEQENFDRLRMKDVLQYVESRLGDKISISEVCKLANMSYYYFVKFFKKTLGMSFTEYVNYRKIKWAERLLLTRDLSIAEVGDQIGMPNMAHFYKMFKKYNDCSPKEYQKRMFAWKQQV
ncbi:helix-turn-helix transcriptional regulator [Paenibacillus pinihumi]|uniref:helix-turn-helix transcriptional regulator n=1 Tax=Paenibacillus pinihumi TaxID=669462 RepID=UPI000419729B|nr:AraC family transcriptional regulator [Paenibacillus pinihumi]